MLVKMENVTMKNHALVGPMRPIMSKNKHPQQCQHLNLSKYKSALQLIMLDWLDGLSPQHVFHGDLLFSFQLPNNVQQNTKNKSMGAANPTNGKHEESYIKQTNDC